MSRAVPRIQSLILGVAALAIGLMAQFRLQEDIIFDAALLYGVAILMALYAFRGNVAYLADDQIARSAPMIGGYLRTEWWWRMLPIVAAIALSISSLRIFHDDLDTPDVRAWRLHIGSVVVMVLTAFVLDWGRRPADQEPSDQTKPSDSLHQDLTGLPEANIQTGPQSDGPIGEQTNTLRLDGQRATGWSQTTLVLLLLILLMAAFLRLYRFDELPFGTWYDEAENGLQALRIQQSEDYWPLFSGSIHAPTHYLYLIATAFDYLGVSTESIRVVSVIMGLATVLAAYLVGRELFGAPMGLTLAFLLAVSRWNVNFSRIGMYNASTPLFELLVVGFLLRGVRRGRLSDFALAGLWLGLGFCFYAAFQLFVATIGLFLLYMIVAQRGFLRRTWVALIVMGLTALLVIAPVLLYAYQESDTYFERTRDTSIFSDKTPEQRIPALLENVRKHLLMFNYQGDPNGRHNLPGAPMLDPYSGALLVLGLALCLVRMRRPYALLLPLWLTMTLLGGILSLDFEAPQSLRAIGTQPVVYILATVPLYLLWQEWQRVGARYFPRAYVAPLLLLLMPLGFSNFYTYFFRQAYDFAAWNAFSTPETITANILKELDDQTEAYVISFFHGHPTVNFLARGSKPYRRLETTDHLPMPWPPDKNIVIITNAESEGIFEEAQRYYPSAQFEEFKAPFGGPTVIGLARLSPADSASITGLNGTYYANADWSGSPQLTRQDGILAFNWADTLPLPLPFSVEWDGVLHVANFGLHQFFLQAPASAQVFIGEDLILSGTGEQATGLMLAKGNHALRVRAVGAAGPFSLAWRPPDRGPELIPASSLYVAPVRANGLLGRYYANNNWEPPATLEQIDAQLNLYFHIIPLPRPYTVEWTGKIAIPQAGRYVFGLESIDESVLFIDEQEITRGLRPNHYSEGSIELTEGLHDIRVRYADRTDHSHINLYWTPPGGYNQIIPSEVLFPPQGNYERIQMPSFSQLVFNPDAPTAPTVTGQTLTGDIQVLQAGLARPKGIAVGPDGTVYVADTENSRLLLLSADGEPITEVRGGNEPFVEPFDVAVDSAGEVYVLDATTGRISIFAPDGAFVRTLAVDPALISRSRGLAVDAMGRIWVANTPGQRVLAFDQAGDILADIPIWPGENSQPVDVLVGNDGGIFVADSGLSKLVRFDPGGRRLFAWEIPAANSMDGPHLALGSDGTIYMSAPEPFTITRLTPDGEPMGQWPLPEEDGRRLKPIGLAVGPDGRIWFVDTGGGRVAVLTPQ